MHSSLRLNKLSRLPPSMRTAANAACGPNRSVQDIRRVMTYLSTGTEEQSVLMLPVFYVNLDPAGIPDEDTFDTEAPPEAGGLIGRALLSLQALYTIKFSADIGPVIWPRVWPWVRFIYLYRDHLPGLPPQSETVFCLEFLMFAGTFADHPETHALILSTPGVRFMAARAWPSVHKLVDPKRREIGFNDLRGFLADKRAAEPAHLSELIDGAGGTLEHLARLVVLYIDSLVSSPNIAMHFMSVHFFSGALDFITTMDPNLRKPDHIYTPTNAFTTALVSKNLVRTLSSALCALSVTTTPQALHEVQRGSSILGLIFSKRLGYHLIADALDHNILRALINCAHHKRHSHIQPFLTVVLPPSLLYYPVISALDRALADVADLLETESFKTCEVYEQWDKFVSLANERLDVFHSYNSGENPSMRACDNMKCSEMGVKSEFNRCGGCQCVYYCSEACQRLDWREGHRKACDSHGTLYLSANDSQLTTVERSFLRAVVHHDSQKEKAQLLIQQLGFMSAYPGQDFLVLYNYTRGAVKFSVQPLNGAPTKERFNGAEWEDIVSRMVRSGGRMRLDAIAMPGTADFRYYAIPLRTNTPAVHEGLRKLARELPADQESWDNDLLAKRLTPLMYHEDPDVLEVH
ncbi:hypothetical protein B0H17DRAFT_1080622 [Mycena rosella]|uniref:phytol kinase n=1 Tax=Mycena rosella TaxID=1033263 RepID=A0AAD7D6C9_MYCRO|nr:hypothetical protein B0H17DRAFT_1080622 [Mycena rosella]